MTALYGTHCFFLRNKEKASRDFLKYIFYYGNSNMTQHESLTKHLHFMIPEKLITLKNKYHFEAHNVCTFI